MSKKNSFDSGAVVRVAFSGLRHPHVFDLFTRCKESADFEIVAVCEPNAEAAKAAAAGHGVEVTHTDLDAMLAEVSADVLAIGDYYGIRGASALKALRAGWHVIADKPICTSLEELDAIESICAEKGLRFGCMLDMRDGAFAATLRRVIGSGRIGEVEAVHFNGQHPLNYGTRAGWYFEPGKHGGTLNDIAIHAVDLIPWMTGSWFESVRGVYTWKKEVAPGVEFEVGAQCLFKLESGAGITGDVSYLTPNSFAYSLPQYWEYRIWGSKGLLEGSTNTKTLTLYEDGETEPEAIEYTDGNPGGYLKDFLADLRGETLSDGLDTAAVLRAARVALTLQAAGDS